MFQRLVLSALLLLVFAVPDRANAAPPCAPKYMGQLLLTPDANGRSMTLKEPFAYQDRACVKWEVPKDAAVDGASIPRPFWPIIGGPWEGAYRNASVIHDWYCAIRTRPWKDVHRMFYEAMLTSGVGSKLAHLMYLAVYYGGPRWDELTIRNSRLMHPDTHLTASVSQALTSLRGALAAGNLSAANFALANAQNDMKTNGDQYVVADATRAISIAVNDKSTQGAALEAMISSGIPDASSLAVLYSQRATIAYESGDKAVAAKNARAALDFGVNPDAVDLIAALKREGIPAVESSTSAFEPNVLEFKRLANIVDERDLTLDQIEKLVNEVRAK